MDGWKDGKKTRKREEFRSKEAGVLREREREREEHHFSKSPAGKMLIISRCFLRVKMHAKKGRPLSRSIFIPSPLHPLFDYPLYSPRCALTRSQRLQFFSLFVSSTSLFFFSFSFFLDRHR